MGLFDKIKTGSSALQKGIEKFSVAERAFSGMTDNAYTKSIGMPTTARDRDGRIGQYADYAQNREEEEDDDDDVPSDSYYRDMPEEREVNDSLRDSFYRRAEMKTDQLIFTLKRNFQWKRVVTNVIVKNSGDDTIVKQYQNADDEDIDRLPKEIRKVLRNSKNLKAIDGIAIDETLRTACIEFFAMEFEEDYRNGLTPDFKDINPIKLLELKMSEPFEKIIGDFVMDFAIDHKQGVVDAIKEAKKKYIDKKPTAPIIQNDTVPIEPEGDEEEEYEEEEYEEEEEEDDEELEEEDINDKWSDFEKKRQGDGGFE
jgi:hypothetical protein